MKIVPSCTFAVSADVAKRNQARKEIITEERIQCFIRMARNGETDEIIALYTTFSLETVKQMRKKLDELMADASVQKSRLFQHHGLSFQTVKPNWLYRVKMAYRFMRNRRIPHSWE